MQIKQVDELDEREELLAFVQEVFGGCAEGIQTPDFDSRGFLASIVMEAIIDQTSVAIYQNGPDGGFTMPLSTYPDSATLPSYLDGRSCASGPTVSIRIPLVRHTVLSSTGTVEDDGWNQIVAFYFIVKYW